MKNKSFMAIVLGSIVVFFALIFSLYFLLKKDKPTFYADGYVSITNSEIPSKAYFTKGTTYKKGYNEDILFKDENNKKINAPIYSFAYYTDKSINYLNDGVLMSLDNMNDEFIPYYNIKSNYLIEYTDGNYIINAKDKDIKLNNFIGRISDSKYIVAGNNLRLKLSSSDDYIENYYFEIEFLDGNLVRINNDKVSLETISSECYILVNDNLRIDLSEKVIKYNDENKLSLDEIVINNDQNIDIKYDDKSSDNNSENENNTTVNNITDNKPGFRVEDRYEVETVVEYKSAPYVELVTSNINSHKIDINFNVIDSNNLISGTVKARLINAVNGNEIELKEYSNYSNINNYIYDGLSSNSKYILTIYATYRNNGAVYNDYVMLQRAFTTSAIGAEIDVDYVTSNELGVVVNIDKGATFTKGTINLYDNEGNIADSYTFENNGENVNHTFENLNANSSYVAKIENITFGALSYPDGAASSVSTKTLKYNPFRNSNIVSSPVAIINKKDYTVKFDLGQINDPNKSIKEVVYKIYDKDTLEEVKEIKKDNTNSFEEKFDLDKNKTYYYNAIITLNDNEKNIEYVTENSNDFNMGSKISPTINFKEIEVTANTMTGLFTIYDPDNTINTDERVYVEYVNSLGESSTYNLTYKECENESATTKCADVHIDTLLSSDTYTVKLYSYVDTEDDAKEPGFEIIGTAKITTEKANIIYTNISANTLTDEEAFNDVFSLNIGLYLDDETPEIIKDNLSSFEIELYEGNEFDKAYLGKMVVNNNIVSDYFDSQKEIKLSDFGFTLQDLIGKHADGIISKNYIIYLKNGVSGSDYVEFRPMSFSFEINDSLLGLSSDDATLVVTKLENINKEIETEYEEDTIVGLRISPSLGDSISSNYIKKYITKINYKIEDVNDNSTEPLTIVKNLSLTESDNLPEETLYLKDYDYLQRGHIYNISYTLTLKFTDNGSEITYPFSNEDITVAKPVAVNGIEIPKQKPYIYMFTWTSDENSITSKYKVYDLDNALINDKVYYSLNDDENYTEGTSIECAKGVVGNTGFKESMFKCIKYNNISGGDIYNTYLNVKLINSKPAEYIKVNDNSFEGINDLNISYEILKENNMPVYNNLLALKIVGDEKDINRITSYSLILSYDNKSFRIDNINNDRLNNYPGVIGINRVYYVDQSNNSNNKEDNMQTFAYINECGDNKCIYVDYSLMYVSPKFGELFNSFKNKEINIDIIAKYDSGKVGFLGSPNNEYAFKTYDLENKYLLLFASNNLSKSDNALGAYYSYSRNINGGGYFVDDYETTVASYQNNYLSGSIFFNNLASNNYNMSMPYKISKNGVTIDLRNAKDTKVIAKELSNKSISLEEKFSYAKVVPTIVNSINSTINGAKMNITLSGIKESDLTDNNVYLEITNENTNKLVQINKNNLTSNTCIVNNKSCKIVPDGVDYLVNIRSVIIDNTEVTDYRFDYLTSTISFDNDAYNGKTVNVIYDVVLYGYDINTTYNVKAYVYINNSKTYLVNGQDTNYNEYNVNFTTKNYSDYVISGTSFEVESPADYSNRKLLLNYNINDLIGFKNITYNIESLDTDSSLELCDNSYYNDLGGKTCVKNSNYDNLAKFTLPDDFVFGKNYNIIIKGEVETLNGENTDVIYSSSLSVRKLKEPTVDVIKSSHYNDSKGYYLDFKVKIEDPDRVIYSNNEKGVILTSLDGNNPQPYNIIGDNNGISVTFLEYKNLESNKAYNLVINYSTKINNDGRALINEDITKNYLTYTLNNNHIAVGNVQYIAENRFNGEPKSINNMYGMSTLRFGYAANIAKDSVVKDAIGEMAEETDTPQEAYVAGILYNIESVDGGGLSIQKYQSFDENSADFVEPIYYRTSGTSEVGDSYYEMILKHSPYLYNDDVSIKNAGYNITYRFYLTGPITSFLDTKEKCENRMVSNIWDAAKNECLVLGGTTYTRTGVASNANNNGEVSS